MNFQEENFRVDTEAAVRRCFTMQTFLKTLQRPQENTCVGVYFLKKLQAVDRRQVKKFAHFLVDCCEN